MKYLMPLALILVLGCTNFAMRAEHTTTELDQLPGRSDPVRVACRDQSEGAPGRLPIQLRPEQGPRAAEAAFVDCMDVLSVFVSVAMDSGDSTEDGLGTVGTGWRAWIPNRSPILAMSTTRLGRPCGFRKFGPAGWPSTSSTRRPRHGMTCGCGAAVGC